MSAMRISPKTIRLIDEIKRDKVHGASELARQAAKVLKISAERSQAGSTEEFLLEQEEIGKRLMSARPAMAPIFNIVSGLLNGITGRVAGMGLGSVRRFTLSRVDEAVRSSLRATARIAEYGAELISDGDKIMTHSYSSTVLAVLEAACGKHKGIEVIVSRSGPGRTGETIARQLGRSGIPLTFIDDVAIGLYISRVNKVVVGADRVCADGKVVNGIGTYQLALAAESARVPFYVLSETLKFDPRLRGEEVDLEEKEPSEVVEPGRLPPEIRVRNPHFDITPLELIAGIVTEKGLVTPEEALAYMSRLGAAGPDIPAPGSL